MTIHEIAAACHEINRQFCFALGDVSQKPWAEAPEWQRTSAVKGVQLHLGRMHEGLPPSPEASHESWLREKVETGWVYGPTKDEDRKTHPCMVPVAELSPEQQAKDVLFMSTVYGLAHLLD